MNLENPRSPTTIERHVGAANGEAMEETIETTGGDRRDRSTTYGILLAVIFSIPVAILIWTILSPN